MYFYPASPVWLAFQLFRIATLFKLAISAMSSLKQQQQQQQQIQRNIYLRCQWKHKNPQKT
jgi:hypothetical protein